MRKLLVAEHVSLDGVVQAPGGPDEDQSGGFRLGGWSAPFANEPVGKVILSLHERPFELLLGRVTYDIWADYWPGVPEGNPIADPFNRTLKHVATNRPHSLRWQNSHPLNGNAITAVEELKATKGDDLLTWGSSDLVRQLLAAGLVDTMWLFVYPLILGAGKRIFDGSAQPASFRMVQTVLAPNGVQALHLERDGDVRTGEFK